LRPGYAVTSPARSLRRRARLYPLASDESALSWRQTDLVLLLATLALCAFGAVMIYTATVHQQRESGLDPRAFLDKQLSYLAAGLIVMMVVALFDYRRLRRLSPLLYLGSLLALLLVLTPLGDIQRGAARWIDLGPFQVQPSEPTKLVVILVLGSVFAEVRGKVVGRHVAAGSALFALPAVLVFLEPDLGTTLVLGAVFGGCLLIGGARGRHFLALGLLLVGVIFAVVQLDLLHDYQERRITAFLDPSPEVGSDAYNVTQSKIAIGSGGLEGKGLEDPRSQTSLDFVPEQPTDFIFTAVGEQLGFVGSSILLGLFAASIWRALLIAGRSPDRFGSVLAGGLAVMWAFQLFVNVGMTMGIMPITGIPLPFISYGGSSLMTNLAGVGLLLSVGLRRPV
jgi:rod shape determining protein RodA